MFRRNFLVNLSNRKSEQDRVIFRCLVVIFPAPDFLESEARSCSMDPGCITPEYVYRMWGGMVPLNEIEQAFKLIKQ